MKIEGAIYLGIGAVDFFLIPVIKGRKVICFAGGQGLSANEAAENALKDRVRWQSFFQTKGVPNGTRRKSKG
ncbi:MAG: hypothetical protein WC793_02485 [Candidatus Paceibacterota bacterium]